MGLCTEGQSSPSLPAPDDQTLDPAAVGLCHVSETVIVFNISQDEMKQSRKYEPRQAF